MFTLTKKTFSRNKENTARYFCQRELFSPAGFESSNAHVLPFVATAFHHSTNSLQHAHVLLYPSAFWEKRSKDITHWKVRQVLGRKNRQTTFCFSSFFRSTSENHLQLGIVYPKFKLHPFISYSPLCR